jgi:hypothetical protein
MNAKLLKLIRCMHAYESTAGGRTRVWASTGPMQAQVQRVRCIASVRVGGRSEDLQR